MAYEGISLIRGVPMGTAAMPYVENRGVRIHYEDEGQGPAVLLHTGAGGDVRIWADAGYLAGLTGFRVIRIDQRGRGLSGRPPTVEGHRFEHFVDDVRAVLDSAHVERAGFWGYSSGILVGIGFGGAYPGRLAGLVGTGALRWRDLAELPAVDEAAEIAADVARGGVAAEVDRHQAISGERFPPAIDANVRAGDATMHALDGVAWLAWKGPRSVLERLSTPILLLTGEREDPDRATERTVASVPGARLVRIPGVGHLGVFARSDLALPHAVPFLREHLAGPVPGGGPRPVDRGGGRAAPPASAFTGPADPSGAARPASGGTSTR